MMRKLCTKGMILLIGIMSICLSLNAKVLQEDETDKSPNLVIWQGEIITIEDKDKATYNDAYVVLSNGGLKTIGFETWNLSRLGYFTDASLVLESEMTAKEIGVTRRTEKGRWYFISHPYELKVSDISLSKAYSSDVKFVVREYDGAKRASNGAGNSWIQLGEDDVMKANRGYIIQVNDKTDLSFDVKNIENVAENPMNSLLSWDCLLVTLQYHDSQNAIDANWNLLGNPYPSYYKVSTFGL